mmetsp:Transcript_51517/g.134079  ORF Transcript_51517/g.134079 Transcript_51517/m.134079 type:complete len:225 (+) Transcript_51517:2199-2873(+)
MSLPRSCSSSCWFFASAAFACMARTSRPSCSICALVASSFFLPSPTSLSEYVFRLDASLASSCRALSVSLHCSCCPLISSICLATPSVFSRMKSASVFATSTTLRTSVSFFWMGTSWASLASFRGRSSSALPFRPSLIFSSFSSWLALKRFALSNSFSRVGASFLRSSASSSSFFAFALSWSAVCFNFSSFCCWKAMSSVNLTSCFSNSWNAAPAFSIFSFSWL